MTFTFNGMNMDSPIVQSILKKNNNGILPDGSIPNNGTIKVSHVTEQHMPDGTVIENETEPEEVKVDTSNLEPEMQDIIDTVHKYQRGEFNNYNPHNESCNCGCRDSRKININSAINNRNNSQEQEQQKTEQQIDYNQQMYQQPMYQQFGYGYQQPVYYNQPIYYDQFGRPIQQIQYQQPYVSQQDAYREYYMFGSPNTIDYSKPIFNNNQQPYGYNVGYNIQEVYNGSGALSHMVFNQQIRSRQEQQQLYQQQLNAYNQQYQQPNTNIPLYANNAVQSSQLNFSQLSSPVQEQPKKKKVRITPDMPKYLQDVIKYNQGYIPDDMDPDPWIQEHGLQYEEDDMLKTFKNMESDERPYGAEHGNDNTQFDQLKGVAAQKHQHQSAMPNFNNININPLVNPQSMVQPYQQQIMSTANPAFANNFGGYRYGWTPMNSTYAFNNNFNPYSAAQQRQQAIEEQKKLEEQRIEKAKRMSRAVHKASGNPISEEELEAIYNPKPPQISKQDQDWYNFQYELSTMVPREQIIKPMVDYQWQKAYEECTKHTRPDMSCMEFLKDAAPEILVDIMRDEERDRRHKIMEREGLDLQAYGLSTIQNNTNGLLNRNLNNNMVRYTTTNAANYASKFYTERQKDFFNAILTQQQ